MAQQFTFSISATTTPTSAVTLTLNGSNDNVAGVTFTCTNACYMQFYGQTDSGSSYIPVSPPYAFPATVTSQQLFVELKGPMLNYQMFVFTASGTSNVSGGLSI